MATTANDNKLLRSVRSVLADPDQIAPAIARAFLEERRLILVSNQRLLEAADQADAGVVAAFRTKLAEHDAELSFDLIQRLLGAQQPSAQRKGNGVVYTPRHVVEAVCARVVKLSREAGSDPNSPDWKALDPSMGAGAFLLGMAELLLRETGARPSEIIERTCSAGRSRTGRVIMPAWQKRQPRVQPRKTSTDKRSCTTSVTGTSWFLGYGHSARSAIVRFSTVDGTSL